MQAFQAVTTSNSAAPTVNRGVVFVHSFYHSILKLIIDDACHMAQLDFLTFETFDHQAISRQIYSS
jgi:hypothetical protein